MDVKVMNVHGLLTFLSQGFAGAPQAKMPKAVDPIDRPDQL